MTTTKVPAEGSRGEGEAHWFLGALGVIKASGKETAGRTMVSEWHAPRGHGSPLIVHHRENVWFYVIQGELTFRVDDQEIVSGAGSFVYVPVDVASAYSVTSGEARFLLVTEPAGFEDFLRVVSVPARASTLPPPTLKPPDPRALVAAAADHGIEILGPPPGT